MAVELADLQVLVSVVRAGGFREAARATGVGASTLSEAVRRLESRLGVRLLTRTTRSITLTDAGARLLERLAPALAEVEAAVDVVNGFRDRPAGTLRLNVPVSASRLVLPGIVPAFLAAYPDIQVEVTAQESLVDVFATGCDAGIRYEERLEQNMIAIPIGPRWQRMTTAAAPAYFAHRERPTHPRDLLQHACLRGRFASGAIPPWEFEKDGEVVKVDVDGPLTVRIGATTDLAVHAALAGVGVIHLFEQWLQPHVDSGALEAVLTDWARPFTGPFLYYPSRRHMPAPLRAFIDFVKRRTGADGDPAADDAAVETKDAAPPGRSKRTRRE